MSASATPRVATPVEEPILFPLAVASDDLSAGAPEMQLARQTNLISFLEARRTRDDETAFAHRRGLRLERWSYARLRKIAFQFARELERRGLQKGERVLLWGENSAEWVAAFFGCLARGVIVVPLDVESAPEFVRRVQEQVGARLLLHTGDRVLDIPRLRFEEMVAAVGSQCGEPFQSSEISENDIAEIIYTSGTTAEPKGVILTHGNLLANLRPLEHEIEKYIKWERFFHPIRFLDLLPLSHVFGQFMGIFVPMILGGEVYFQSSLNPTEIIAAIRSHRISVVIAVPRLLDSLRQKIERDYAGSGDREALERRLEAAERLRFLRRWWEFRRIHRQFGWKFWAFVTGGASLGPQSEAFWRRLGYAVVQGYGMTETAALISVNHPFKIGRGSIGKALPGQRMKLGEGGEILVRGDNVSPGYWQRDSESMITEDGWLRTGDIGEMDEAGNLYFRGRKKDVIVTAAGLNIYSEDLEAALNIQPEIRDSAVIGIETAQGPEPMAVLILSREGADAATAVEHANQRLSPQQRIRHWKLWPDPEFPLTPTKKIRKPAVAKRMEATRTGERGSRGAENQGGGGEVSFLVQQVAQLRNGRSASPDVTADLAIDLKLDSLGRVELLSALEDHYQLDLDESAFTDATTVADIERMICEGGRGTAPVQSDPYPYPKWPRRFPITWIRAALFYLVLFPITWVMARPRVCGKEKLQDAGGPLLFVSNHISRADQSLVQYALPSRYKLRLAIAMDGEKLRGWRRPPRGTALARRLLGWAQYLLVSLFFNVFPLPRKSGFRRSFAFAGELMDRGTNILVFPEGRRAPDSRMHPFLEGVGMLAKELGVAVVPIRLDGLYEMKEAGRRFAHAGEVRVMIGEPIEFSRDDDPELITRELSRRVASL